MNTCSACHETLPLEAFRPERNQCKQCYKSAKKRYDQSRYPKRREESLARNKRYRLRHRERIKRLDAEKRFRHEYGIDFEDWARMYEAQEYRCALCSERLDFGRRTCVDHCHRSGRVRGLLCQSCNVGVGGYERMKVREETVRLYLSAPKAPGL